MHVNACCCMPSCLRCRQCCSAVLLPVLQTTIGGLVRTLYQYAVVQIAALPMVLLLLLLG